MPFKYLPPTFAEGEDLLAMDGVREALHQEAEKRLAVARQLAEADGMSQFASSLRVEDGTRPKGRPYSQVVADDPQGEAVEFGDTDTERRRILGRAGNVQINTQG